jgi:hypothetical protein
MPARMIDFWAWVRLLSLFFYGRMKQCVSEIRALGLLKARIFRPVNARIRPDCHWYKK